jgi:hypothetical protein
MSRAAILQDAARKVLLFDQGRPAEENLRGTKTPPVRANPKRRRDKTQQTYSGPRLYQRPLPYQPPPPSNKTNSTTIKIVSMVILHL